MILGAALLAALLILLFQRQIDRQLYPREYTLLVTSAAAEYALAPALLYAVIHTESHFNPQAVSSDGARGLMQIMPETFDWLQTKTGENLTPDSLFEPEVSVRYGALLLRYLLDEFDQTETALAAYHAGRGQVNRWLRDPHYSQDGQTLREIPFKDTRHYVDKVMNAYEKYQNLGEKE